MKEEDLLQWFSKELLPSIVTSGKFSEGKENQTLEKCDFEAIEKYVNSFASAPCFAKLQLKTPSGILRRGILIKFQNQNELFRTKMRTVPQYFNEVTLYNEVIPGFVDFLKFCDQSPDFVRNIVPKSYFASTGDGDVEKAVLILEDLRSFGFKPSDSVLDLDLNHCLISVEKLAEFHAISYAMKFKGWKEFDKLKTSFLEVWLEDIPMCREVSEEFQGYVSTRGIDYLLSQKDSPVPKDYLENFRLMLKSTFDLQKSLATPSEPLSVICHGDFNRNNILYRYDNGKVVEAKLIDFQKIFYGSPCLDLGFLIYLNTTLAFRENHFDQVFEHYYRSLLKNTSVILKETEQTVSDKIPVQAFKKDFEKTAVWHYITASFFLPIMMTPPDGEFESDMKLSYKEMAKKNYNKGGDAVSKRISEIIIDFYRRKFYL